ncbi:hypothetical protein KUW14_12855 [Pseudooceanicola nitratireducens]|uniref:hypothetical protein n=1 Tax=Pseudooceanicola nitratireducens TaxID=517719 RepID=UPI001C972436|nr:hypothetical protein [Pseudooceanicola nitratireducens]MBY6166736.1 hypothetical protein [Pseudooceanicola nitratireducens]
MAHWYTADPHFGHEAILAHAGRPFRSIDHMDATLIERMWSRTKSNSATHGAPTRTASILSTRKNAPS